MKSITKRLLAGVAAAATLLSGMALTGSAMAADTAISTADLDAVNQTLTVTATFSEDLANKTLYAIRLAKYSAAQTDGTNITGYDVADAGLATTVDAALKSANIIGSDNKVVASAIAQSNGDYDINNPMQWVVQNLLDSGTSPYSGQLRNFLTKLAAQDLSSHESNDNVMTISGASATKTVAPGIYVIIDKLQTGDDADGKTVVSMPMMTATGITSGGKSYATLKKSDGTTIDLNTVQYKATKPTVDKKIVEGTDRVESNVAAIGDTVTYELTTTIPNYTGYDQGYYLALNDTLSKGLTFKEITSVKVEGVDTEYKNNAQFYAKTELSDVTSSDAYNGGKSFSILFAPTTGANGKQTSDITKQADLFLIGKKITVRYTAILNESAVINGNGNPNKVNLTYSRNPNGEEHGDSDNVEVKTYTGNLRLHKVDAKGNSLKGAKFEIRSSETGDALKVSDPNNNGNYVVDADQTSRNTNTNTTLVVPEGGILAISGLNGTYYIKETESPFKASALPSFTVNVNVRQVAEGNNVAGTQTVTLTKADANQLVKLDEDNNADANIKVTNVHNFTEMPKTGATWLAIYAAMAVLCGGGAFLLLRSSKKRA